MGAGQQARYLQEVCAAPVPGRGQAEPLLRWGRCAHRGCAEVHRVGDLHSWGLCQGGQRPRQGQDRRQTVPLQGAEGAATPHARGMLTSHGAQTCDLSRPLRATKGRFSLPAATQAAHTGKQELKGKRK
jgi:hypothetical protein